ncbi:MAG: hypothetical protein ACPGJS_10685 [Flammeovirgaceae bacterium]
MKQVWSFTKHFSNLSRIQKYGKQFMIFACIIGAPLAAQAQAEFTDYRDGSDNKTRDSYRTDVISIHVNNQGDNEFITNALRTSGDKYGLSFFVEGYETLRLWSSGTTHTESFMRLSPDTWGITTVGGGRPIPMYSKSTLYLGKDDENWVSATYNQGLTYYTTGYHEFRDGNDNEGDLLIDNYELKFLNPGQAHWSLFNDSGDGDFHIARTSGSTETGTSNASAAYLFTLDQANLRAGIGTGAANPEATLHIHANDAVSDVMIGELNHATNNVLRLLGDDSEAGIIQVGSTADANKGDLIFSTMYDRDSNMNSFTVRADDATFTGNINAGKGLLFTNQEGDRFGTWDGSQYTTAPTSGTLMFDYNWADDEYNWENYFVQGEDDPNVIDDDQNVGGLALYSSNLGYYGQGGWELMLTTHNMYLLKAKFHSVATTDVIVRPDGNFPDYVFDKNYKLMPLEEVESYIKKHHHLPNVISAKEAEEKGVSVAKMQEALLEKVEEMTLYLIQMKKENELLKERVKQLEAQK